MGLCLVQCCVQACPVGIDPLSAIMDMRQYLMEQSAHHRTQQHDGQ